MSIIAVAKASGVSKSTVSRVINGSGPVKKHTRRKVLQAMEELGYYPNVFAQGMKTNRSRTVAVMIPDFRNPYFADWMGGIEQVLRENDYLSLVCSTGVESESEYETLRTLLQRRIDGILFCSYSKNRKTLALLREIEPRIPVVYMDPMMKRRGACCVFADGQRGTYDAVQYLVDGGRRRIAYIKGPSHYLVTDERYQGYRKAITDGALPTDPDYVYEGDFRFESGFEAARHFAALNPRPDAVVSATDYMALGALRYFLRHGIKVPGEVSLIGFDNISLTTLVEPNLTTIAMPIEELGRSAADILMRRIDDPAAKPEQIVFPCELVVRETT